VNNQKRKLPQGFSLTLFRELIQKLEHMIEAHSISYTKVTAEEVIDYFSLDTPTGDFTTIKDVAKHRFLLLHEMIEISEIRKMGLKLTPSLFTTYYKQVLEAHVTATEWEFFLAKKLGNEEWIRKRLPLIEDWIPEMPDALQERCIKLRNKYS